MGSFSASVVDGPDHLLCCASVRNGCIGRLSISRAVPGDRKVTPFVAEIHKHRLFVQTFRIIDRHSFSQSLKTFGGLFDRQTDGGPGIHMRVTWGYVPDTVPKTPGLRSIALRYGRVLDFPTK